MSFLLLLTGCKPIAYTITPDEEKTGSSGTEEVTAEVTTTASLDKYTSQPVNINSQDYVKEIQLEEACSNDMHQYLTGYNGDGYIQIDKWEMATFSVYVPSTQYYKLTLYMCAFDTGVDVIVGGERVYNAEEGYETYNGVSKGIIFAEDVTAFTPFTLNGIYLKKGDNLITLQSVKGTAYMDMVLIQKGRSAGEGYYTISNAPVSPNASLSTCKIMNYFSEIYGEKTLTAQQVTSGTNAELAAIYNSTGRLPAMRVGELSFAQSRVAGYDEDLPDLELAEQWAEQGGIVGYDWLWYSPGDNSHYLSSMTDFDISKLYSDPDLSEVSMETVEKLYGNGELSREGFKLIQDIEEIKEVFVRLQEKGITVVFRPMPDAGNGGYWWSADSDSYKWLWQCLFKRLTGYYGLGNIIWVWSGGSADFFPGDEYVDIVGEDIYNTTGDSGNSRFLGTAYYGTVRAGAMSDCLMIPDPDVLVQDNARWLYFSLGKGDRLIDGNGKLNYRYTSPELLDKAYNHNDYVTLDELPSFK